MKKYIITENQFIKLVEFIIISKTEEEKAIEEAKKRTQMTIWFGNNIVDQVEIRPDSKYLNDIVYVDKNTDQMYIRYDPETRNLYFDNNIWLFFASNYFPNNEKIRDLIKHLMGEYYNLKNIKYIFSMSPYK